MILLIILANSNDHGSLRTSRLIKLFRILTLYLYNSWYNLKSKRDISIFDRQSNASVETILSSKYTLESPVKAHRKITGEGRGFKVTMNHLMAGMVILNPYKKNFKLDRDIYFLLGIDQRLQERNLTGRFTSLNTNLFYCDLLDKDENLFNGEPTVSYVTKNITKEGYHIHTNFVSRQNKEIINFNGMPVRFDLEIPFLKCLLKIFC